MKQFLLDAWDWLKRAFGRSRTIFVNVFGILSAIFMEMSDYLTNFNFDDFFKHEVAAAIGFVVQMLNIYFRYTTTNPVSFKALPPPVNFPVEADEDVPQSPKAE